MQIRDWCMLTIIARAILAASSVGARRKSTTSGGSRALPNIEVVKQLLDALGQTRILDDDGEGSPRHDRRYALSSEKLMRETGCAPRSRRRRLEKNHRLVSGKLSLDRPREVGRVSRILPQNYANR